MVSKKVYSPAFSSQSGPLLQQVWPRPGFTVCLIGDPFLPGRQSALGWGPNCRTWAAEGAAAAASQAGASAAGTGGCAKF